jgi:hypothetical protein
VSVVEAKSRCPVGTEPADGLRVVSGTRRTGTPSRYETTEEATGRCEGGEGSEISESGA